MCFGHLAKLAVKTYMFRCESIGKAPPKDSNLSGCRRTTEVNLCIGNVKPILLAVINWRTSYRRDIYCRLLARKQSKTMDS